MFKNKPNTFEPNTFWLNNNQLKVATVASSIENYFELWVFQIIGFDLNRRQANLNSTSFHKFLIRIGGNRHTMAIENQLKFVKPIFICIQAFFGASRASFTLHTKEMAASGSLSPVEQVLYFNMAPFKIIWKFMPKFDYQFSRTWT